MAGWRRICGCRAHETLQYTHIGWLQSLLQHCCLHCFWFFQTCTETGVGNCANVCKCVHCDKFGKWQPTVLPWHRTWLMVIAAWANSVDDHQSVLVLTVTKGINSLPCCELGMPEAQALGTAAGSHMCQLWRCPIKLRGPASLQKSGALPHLLSQLKQKDNQFLGGLCFSFGGLEPVERLSWA